MPTEFGILYGRPDHRNLREDSPRPEKGQQIYFDADAALNKKIKGFGPRVTKSDARTFILDYRFEGRQRRHKLGTYPEMPDTAARRLAHKAGTRISAGEDTQAEGQERRTAPTVIDLWQVYETTPLPNKREKNRREDRRFRAQRNDHREGPWSHPTGDDGPLCKSGHPSS